MSSLLRLRAAVVGLGFLFGVLELLQDLPLVTTRVVVVGVLLGLLLGALLAGMARVHGLFLVEVVVLVLVKVVLGHGGRWAGVAEVPLKAITETGHE